MSDFDKEAERERLREKYEREQEKREVTEKMSELLLQGATMTNAHCSDCGDPIFRYDGQEFCATCEKAVERDTGDEDAAGETDQSAPDVGENGDAGEQIEVTSPSDDARVQFGGDTGGDRNQADTALSATGESAAADSTGRTPAAQPGQSANQSGSRTAGAQPGQTADDSAPREVPSIEPESAGDLGAAVASLTRTVTDLARRAEAAEDLDHKRDLLAATEDAAEALEAVHDVGQ